MSRMRTVKLNPWPPGKPPSSAYCGEDARASILATYGLDALEDDPELSEITTFAANLCNAPIALVSLVERERQRFLARAGLEENETPRPTSFCAHAMLEPEPMVIPDAKTDERFSTNPLVNGHPYIRFYAGAPLISHEGAPLGSLCVIDTEPREEGLTPLQMEGLQVLAASVMRRLRHRRENLEQLAVIAESEKKFRLVADSIPDIAWSTDIHGQPVFCNRRFFEFTGHEPDDLSADMFRDYWLPEEREHWLGDWQKTLEAGEPYEAEYRFRRNDGKYVWMLSRALPLHDANGEITGWFGTLTDIDDTHRQKEERELLAGELAHRIKNIFSVISGLISLRSRGDEKLETFGQELTAAIRSLGRAQDFVRPLDSEKSDELVALLDILMAPYQDGAGKRVALTGDRVEVGPRAATPLALIFHELATNAAKYGALSEVVGRVTIAIERREDSVTIAWQEHGGPEVQEPDSQGFGSRLIDMATRNQLGGNLDKVWDANGLAVNITLPLERIGA